MTPRQAVARARSFFDTEIWSTSLQGAGWGRVLVTRTSRAVYAIIQGFREKDLTVRAASLTYYSVLSIVPSLAFAFSLLKGFGVYQRLMDEAARPWLRATFAGDESLLRALEQMLSFVERTSVSGLSIFGVLLLAYTSLSMLWTVEVAFNVIWGAPTTRPLARKVTDYTTMMVIGPLFVMAALALEAAAQNSAFVAFLRQSTLLGSIVDFALGLTSLVLVTVAFVALYVIMPNVRTRISSALFGGVVAGLSWQGLLLLHVKLQLGVASYNALYASFAALPVFLVWLYLSWIIVLCGAVLAAGLQYEKRFKQAIRSRHINQEMREALVVVVAAAAGRRFLEGGPPVTSLELADALEVPPPAVEHALHALVAARVLAEVVHEGAPAYTPARDLDAVRMADLEEAVRLDPEAGELKSVLGRTCGPALSALLRGRREEARAGAGGLTLRELANRWGDSAAPVQRGGATTV